MAVKSLLLDAKSGNMQSAMFQGGEDMIMSILLGATAHSSGVTQSKVSSVQWLELTSLLYKAAFSKPGTSSLMVRNTVPSPAQGSNMTGCVHSLSSFLQLIKTERGRTSSGLVANVTGLLRARSQYVRSLVACFWGTGYP